MPTSSILQCGSDLLPHLIGLRPYTFFWIVNYLKVIAFSSDEINLLFYNYLMFQFEWAELENCQILFWKIARISEFEKFTFSENLNNLENS